MEIRNVSSAALEIAATGQIVGPWESVEVEDGLGRSLVEQRDVWRSGEGPERPAKSAPKADWVAYAAEQGVEDAEEMTKDELVSRFTDSDDESDNNAADSGEEG